MTIHTYITIDESTVQNFDQVRSSGILGQENGRPGGSVGNLEPFRRWDVSSNPGAATRTGIFPHKKNKIKINVQQVENDYFVSIQKIDIVYITVDEGKKVDDKSCVTFLLCDPGWYVHKPDVQNKWEDNTHYCCILCRLQLLFTNVCMYV